MSSRPDGGRARSPLRLARAAALALSLTASGCLTPPAVLSASHIDIQGALAAYPEGTETVAYEVEPGVWLRGVFVPSDEDAPVLLHLLESSGSSAATLLGFHELTGQLADLGFASLLVDYRGVGLSDGARSPKHLSADARIMWQAAVERAGGSDRVWIRATSLGTLVAALLWSDGARPAGSVLVLPVRAETATERFARVLKGPGWAWAAKLFYRDIVDVDLVRELGRAPQPCRVVVSPDDPFLGQAERERLREAALSSGCEWIERGGDHFEVALEGRSLLGEELSFWADRADVPAQERAEGVLAALPQQVVDRFASEAARARLDALARYRRRGPPEPFAAAALAVSDPLEAARLLWLIDRRPYHELDFDDWVDALRFEDGLGALSIGLLEDSARPLDLTTRVGAIRVSIGTREIVTLVRNWSPGATGFYTRYSIELGNGISGAVEHSDDEWLEALHAGGASVLEIRRAYARLLLKTYRVPDRLRIEPDGETVLQARHEGDWIRLYLER